MNSSKEEERRVQVLRPNLVTMTDEQYERAIQSLARLFADLAESTKRHPSVLADNHDSEVSSVVPIAKPEGT